MNPSIRNFPLIFSIYFSLALFSVSVASFAQEKKQNPLNEEKETPNSKLIDESKTQSLHKIAVEDKIKLATCSLYTEQVIGWKYFKSSSQIWTKGIIETKKKGEMATSGERKVRAIGLGEEGDCVVFFTLRSFVDPLYPNVSIQKVDCPITGKDGKAIDLLNDSMNREKYIRYSKFQLGWFKDVGGGASQVTGIIETVSEFDQDNPAKYESTKSWGVEKVKKETFEKGDWDRPHEGISVEQHFYYKRIGEKNQTKIRFFENHDVVLLYVPKGVFKEAGLPLPETLGMLNPTCATDLALRRSSELFGFNFNLIGQETMDSIKTYVPPNGKGKYSGFEKLLDIVGLAMSPSTFQMLISVDKMLDKVIPNTNSANKLADIWSLYKTITPDQMRVIASGLLALMRPMSVKN